MLVQTLNIVDSKAEMKEVEINLDTIVELRIGNFRSYTNKNTFKKYIKRYSVLIVIDGISTLITGIRDCTFKDMLETIKNDPTRTIHKIQKDYIYTTKGYAERKAIDYTFYVR